MLLFKTAGYYRVKSRPHFPEGSNRSGKLEPDRSAGSRAAGSRQLATASRRASFGGRGQCVGKHTVRPEALGLEPGPHKTRATDTWGRGSSRTPPARNQRFHNGSGHLGWVVLLWCRIGGVQAGTCAGPQPGLSHQSHWVQ